MHNVNDLSPSDSVLCLARQVFKISVAGKRYPSADYTYLVDVYLQPSFVTGLSMFGTKCCLVPV